MVADRYRVVALLGRGGMGEVYRAEDLKLSQVLAIKFLPEKLTEDPAALARFHSEVRIARQVSHPNVCRVFDIGDADGIPFLTMEYVDGEDLSSVVRRIGRLPQDKAAEVSRQICAGLAAAHERGVIHRDLKPSNVMLDGAGKARITDFGLASVAATIAGAEARAGTPAYMAPEQLSGKEVTAKSDIYSLGLVMYELVTGRRAFDAVTAAELIKSRQAGTIPTPSSIVRDLDPLLERAIFRCLDPDPAKRPSSALQVAAALPGGDPLAAALAAGETPSPEMVAAAGKGESIRPNLALLCLVSLIVLLVACTFLGYRESGLRAINPQRSPEVLAQKAKEIISGSGYPEQATDSASGFTYDSDYLEYLEKKDQPGKAWNEVVTGRVPVLLFWFRQSPKQLVAQELWRISLTPGIVSFDDPPEIYSGMVNVQLDVQGRLLYLQVIPPERDENPPREITTDWQPLFAAAGLNLGDFRAATPTWNSLAAADARAAWDGTWPGTTRPLHIEAGAWRGKPVFFMLAGPWTTATRMLGPEPPGSERAAQIFRVSFALLIVFGAAWLAIRNYRRGKGDRRGALRLAVAVFLLEMALFMVRAHLSLTTSALDLLAYALSSGLLVSAVLWTLYMALEPYVRSKWPQTIVSWSRLLAGNWRDPLVGRDLLFGTVLGVVWVLVFLSGYTFDIRAGESPLLPATDILEGPHATLGIWLTNIVGAIFGVLSFFFVLVLLRVLVRNRWLAAALFVLLYTVPKFLASHHPAIDLPVWILIYTIAAFAVVRFGLIALAAAVFTANVLLNLPYTLDFSKWYAGQSMAVVLSFAFLAGWGFYTALAGRRIFTGELFD
jgi:Protein kinase domain